VPQNYRIALLDSEVNTILNEKYMIMHAKEQREAMKSKLELIESKKKRGLGRPSFQS